MRRRVRYGGHGVPAWPAPRRFRGQAGCPAASDGAQRLDLSWPGRPVLRRLALSADDDDVDGKRDPDRVAVHSGERCMVPSGVPVRARELSDPDAPAGPSDGISLRGGWLLAALTSNGG